MRLPASKTSSFVFSGVSVTDGDSTDDVVSEDGVEVLQEKKRPHVNNIEQTIKKRRVRLMPDIASTTNRRALFKSNSKINYI
jgi:hypothetical protein